MDEQFKYLPVEEETEPADVDFWPELTRGAKYVVLALLRSRKVWVAAGGLATTVAAHFFSVPAEIWMAIDAFGLALIGAIAWEDAAEKR